MGLKLSFLFILLACASYAQRIDNLTTVLAGEHIEITFDLIDEVGGRTFDLQLFSSHDNYASLLQYVSGDIGEEVSPGAGKKVIWEAKKELGEYKGEIYLEIRGIVTPPFVRILTPNVGEKFKPGKTTEIRWDSDVTGNIRIDLYEGRNRISTIATTQNTGRFNWTLSKKLSKGDKYRLIFTSDSKPGKRVESQQFVVAKGIPIWLVVAGVAVVGGVVGVIVSSKGEPLLDDGPVNNDIPDPIKPGGE